MEYRYKHPIWTPTLSPSENCGYHHCKAITPFGFLRIEWDGWKNLPSFSLYLDDNYEKELYGVSVAQCIEEANEYFKTKVMACFEEADNGSKGGE